MTMHNERPMQDAAATAATAYTISAGDTFVGTITDSRGDTEDWIKIEMEAGTTYTISVSGTLSSEGNGKMDTILTLLDSKGGEIRMNDDDTTPGMDGISPGSKLEFTPEVSGTYYISVSTYQNNPNLDNSGSYTLSVTGMTVDPATGDTRTGTDRVPDDTSTADVNEYVSGNDKLKGGAADDKLNGGSGDDTLYGMAGDDTLDGGPDDDLLVGGPGADTLKGGTGDDDTIDYAHSPLGVTINLTTGTARGGDADGDTIVSMGTDRIENIRGSMYDDMLTGSARANKLWGLAGDDDLNGGRREDELYGGAGNDTLDGGAGNDTLQGGSGADMLTGGAGNDTASYSLSIMGVTVRLHSGQAMGGDAEGDTWSLSETVDYTDNDEKMAKATVADIENLTGSAFADILAGDLRNNTIKGGAGNDMIYGGPNPANADKETGGGLDNVDNLYGEGGNDRLYGGWGDDVLKGGGGNDRLWGGPGNDTFWGGHGSDMIHADAADRNIYGNRSDDTATTSVDENMEMMGDVDTVSFAKLEEGITRTLGSDGTGNATDGTNVVIDGIENIIGTQGDDKLTGDNGDNVIEGHEGGDTMDGGDHGMNGDTVSYEHSDDWVRITLTNGTATASRGHASGDIITNFENVRGSMYDDELTGNDEPNKLWGMVGDDEIEGGAGNDTIEGGAGADELNGGYSDSDTDTNGNQANSEANTLSYENSNAAVIVSLATASASGGHATGDTIVTYEESSPTRDDPENKIDVPTFAHVTGSRNNDRLTGNHHDNHLAGGVGNDILGGGAGADRVIGGPGADTLDGGEDRGESNNMVSGDADSDGTVEQGEMVAASIDWAVYKHAMAGVTVDLSTGMGTGGEAMGDTLMNIELIWGSEHGDTFISNGGNIIEGDGGSDTVSYEASSLGVRVDLSDDDQHTTVVADTSDSDNVIQFPNTDPNATDLTGAASGLAGVLKLNAQGVAFNDSDNVEDRDDNPNANGAAGDKLRSIENLTGSARKDVLTGDEQNNELRGMGGDDTLVGGSGNDKLFGGDGDDALSSASGMNELHGGAGDDIITGGSGNDTINAGAGDDQIAIVSGGDDTLVFSPDDGDGDDTVTGFVASTDAVGDKIDLSAYDLTRAQLMASIDLFGVNVRIDLTEHGGGKIILNLGDIDDVDAATGDDDTDGTLDMVSIVDDSGNGVFII